MSGLIDILGNGLTGGVFGLAGSLVTQVMGYFTERQRQTFKLKEYDHELELLKFQSAQKQQETESEVRLTETKGSYDGLVASINAMSQERASWPIVDAIKSLMRPVITIMSMVLTGYLLATSSDADVLSRMIDTVDFVTSSSVAWWFGDRAPHLVSKKR